MAKPSRSRLTLLVALALLTLAAPPLLAQVALQEVPEGFCPPPAADAGDGSRTSSIVPLQPEERLLHRLADLSAGALEVRYRLNGQLHLTELLDLGQMKLPERAASGGDGPPRTAAFARGETGAGAALPPRRAASEGVRAIELLTLHPDTARELHRLAASGATIELDVLHDGALRETLSFAEVLRRSAALRAGMLVPVFAPSVVEGAGVVAGARKLRVATNEYLESCSDCTSSHPCDTECGYDPGKGGPTTCGEYGAPCEPWCPSSYTSGEWWTDWTYYSSGYGVGRCLKTWFGDRWHNEIITTYRREKIRRTTTCPNSPSCSGCYDTEEVVEVQYANTFCYEETGGGCFNAEMPCCWTCSVYGWTQCSNSLPCF